MFDSTIANIHFLCAFIFLIVIKSLTSPSLLRLVFSSLYTLHIKIKQKSDCVVMKRII